MNSQDNDILSYHKLFELLEKDNIEKSTKNVIQAIKSEYEFNHKNEFSSFVEKIEEFSELVCPICGMTNLIRYGKTKNGTPRYKCKNCGKIFNIANNSIFFSSKVNITAWYSFIESIVSETSVKAAAIKAKISFTTAMYWMKKIFLSIQNYQNDIVLDGRIYLDETYYSKEKSKIIKKGDEKLRGLSINQLCVEILKNKRHVVILFIGDGAPSAESLLSKVKNHIKTGSILYHDGDHSHYKIVKDLNLEDRFFKAKMPNGKLNNEALEKLEPINDECKMLNFFLDKHRGLNKDELQNYLNLYSFLRNNKISNPNYYLITVELMKRLVKLKRNELITNTLL